MTAPTCRICGRRIKANQAALLTHTSTTTETVHIACLRERAPTSQTEKAKAA